MPIRRGQPEIRFRRGLWAIVACCLVGIASTGWAQSTPAETPSTTPVNPTTAPTVEPGQPGDSFYVRDENGKPVLVVAPKALFLEWLESRLKQGAPADARYSITSIALTGTADDQWCQLQARIAIHLNADRDFVLVPLHLNEGNLSEINYVGPGEYIYEGFDQKQGYQWWFKGKGDHELQLKFTAPVRKQVQTRRLLLTLPPRAGASSLRLTVDTPQAVFKYPEKSSLVPNGDSELTASQSTLSLLGLGESFDLSWQPTPQQQSEKTSLQSHTDLDVSFTGDSILMKARQRIAATQGNFRELVIRLPQDFSRQNPKITGNQSESVLPITDRPNWVRVTLMQPTSGPIDLEWVLERAMPPAGETFRLEGFELEGESLQQTGNLTLSSLTGYRLREHQRQGVFRRRVTNVETQRDVLRAYEFYRQPFALDLELQKIPPSFVITSDARVRYAGDAMALDIKFNVDLFRGTLEQLAIEWADWQKHGWRIEPTSNPELIESFEPVTDDPSQVLVRFREPVSSKFEFSFRASRATPDLSAPLSIRIPRILGDDAPQSVGLVLEAKLNLDVDVTPSLPPRDLPTSPPAIAAADSEYRELKRYRFLSTQPIDLTARVVPRTQTIVTASELELAPTEAEDMVQVDQVIRYDVRYEPITTLRFRTSAANLNTLTAFSDNGESGEIESNGDRKLTINELPGTIGAVRQFSVDLPQQELGNFAIRFRSSWTRSEIPLPGTDPGPPVVQSVDAEFTSLRLKLRDSLGDYLQLAESRWKRRPSLEREIAEFELGDKTVPLHIELQPATPDDAASAWSVQRAFLESSTDGDGTIRTRGVYRLEGSFPFLEVALPEGYQLSEVTLNGVDQPLPATPPDERLVTLSIPTSIRKGREIGLEIVILSTLARPLTWSSEISFEAPQLLAARHKGSTYWMTTLPYRQHLFTLPARFNPQFEWARERFLWTRLPLRSADALLAWASDYRNPEEPPTAMNGNMYLFHSFGEPAVLSYQTMNRPLVILVGAGMALVLSFLLLRLSATKNVLTFLILALGLSVAAVWYPTSVALLLQPAILGFLLAVLATTFDRLMRSEPSAPVITLEEIRKQESDFGSSSAAATREYSPPLGSEEPTEVRLRPAAGAQESLSSSFGATGE